jgi:hypothetical protein
MKQAMTSFPPPTGEPNLYTMTDNPDPPPQQQQQQQQQALLQAGPKEADDSKPSPIAAPPPPETTTAPHDMDTNTPTNTLQELEDFSIHNSNLDVERKGGDIWDSVAEI